MARISKKQQQAERTAELKKDFRKFLFVVWQFLGLPEPTRGQYALAKRLQHGPDRDIILGFRGFAKSWVCTTYDVFELWNNPDLKVGAVSAGRELATDITQFALNIINSMDELIELRPKDNQRQSKLAFDVGLAKPAKDASMKSAGITGQLPGNRWNLIVGDDVETPKTAATQGQRIKLSEAVREFESIITPGGKIKYLGTPQLEDTLYYNLPSRGYSVWVWPARYPDKDYADFLGDWLAEELREDLKRDPSLEGKPTDPQRFNEEVLLKKEIGEGPTRFRLQYMLDARLKTDQIYPLKVKNLVIMSLNQDTAPEQVIWSASQEYVLNHLPNLAFNGDSYYRPAKTQGQWQTFTKTVMYIDPSGKGKDETSYAVAKALNSQIFLTASGGFIDGFSPDTLDALADIAAKHKVDSVVIETNYGSGMFTQLFKPVLSRRHACKVEDDHVTGRKEWRIADDLEPLTASHRLIVDESVILEDFESIQSYPIDERLDYSLIYQFTRLKRETGCLVHDDRVEAVAGVCRYLANLMGFDQAKTIEETEKQRREEFLAAKLARRGLLGKGKKSWIRYR